VTEHRLYYAYARHALVTACALVRVGRGSSVLVPDFICRDVLASLSAVGAEVHFYSTGDDLQIPTNFSLPDADAIIAVNYFGFPADLARIRSALPSRDIAIIEDNAHGWLSRDEHGMLLGTRTEVSITSIRKTIRVPDGAYLEWRADTNLDMTALHEPLSSRDEALTFGFQLRHKVQRLDRLSPVSLMDLGRQAVRSLRRIRGKAPVDDRATEEWELPTHRAIHRTSLELISRVDHEVEVQRRRELFARCVSAAQRLGVETPTTKLAPGVSPQGFPYFGDTGDVTAFLDVVRRERFGEAISWPSLPQRSTLAPSSRLRTLHLVNFLS
jgi:hypothetical protein